MTHMFTPPTTHRAGDVRPQLTRTNTRLIAMIKDRLGEVMTTALNWPDLSDQLQHLGFGLRELGGNIALVSLHSGARLCSISDLGHRRDDIEAQLGGPFRLSAVPLILPGGA